MNTKILKKFFKLIVLILIIMSFKGFSFSNEKELLCPQTIIMPEVTDILNPQRPELIEADTTQCRTVGLFWISSYDSDSILKTYRIYSNGELFAETQGTPEFFYRNRNREYRATGLDCNTTYTFGVSAVDIYENESPIAEFDPVTTPPSNATNCLDTTPPSVPTGLSIEPDNLEYCCRSIALFSDDNSTDSSSGLRGYHLYRDGVKIHQSETIDGDWITPIGVIPGATYSFYLTAVDNAGNESMPSASVSYTIPFCNMHLGEIKTAVFAVNLPNTPETSLTVSDIEARIFGKEFEPGTELHEEPVPTVPSLKGYVKEVSYNKIDVKNAGVYGWITLPGTKSDYCSEINSAGYCTQCNYSKVHIDATQLAAELHDFNPSEDIDRYIFIIRGQVQNMAGVKALYLNSAGLTTMIHEFGHTFGLNHAADWQGRDFEEPAGARRSFPPDYRDPAFSAYSVYAYGDPYNRMGSSGRFHFSVFQKELMGVIEQGQIGHVTKDGYYILDQVEFSSNGIKELRIPIMENGSTIKAPFLSAEYRTGAGYNGPLSNSDKTFQGIQLRLAVDRFYGARSDTIYIAELTEDDPVFNDWYRDMQFTLIEMNGESAEIRICGVNKFFEEPFPGDSYPGDSDTDDPFPGDSYPGESDTDESFPDESYPKDTSSK